MLSHFEFQKTNAIVLISQASSGIVGLNLIHCHFLQREGVITFTRGATFVWVFISDLYWWLFIGGVENEETATSKM